MTEHSNQHQTVPYTRNLREARPGDELPRSYYLAQKEDTAGQLTLNEVIIQRGQEPPPHIHTREDEAFYLLDGAATFYVGEQSFSASPGTFIWLPRNIQHSFVIDSASARFLVFILPAGLEHYFAQMAQLFQQEQVQPGRISPETANKWQQLSQQFGITLNP